MIFKVLVTTTKMLVETTKMLVLHLECFSTIIIFVLPSGIKVSTIKIPAPTSNMVLFTFEMLAQASRGGN